MLIVNPRTRRGPYEASLRALLNIESAREGRRWLSSWPELSPGPTPLWALPRLARRWSLGRISVKDESVRSGLGSFKALGAPLALLRLIQRHRPHEVLLPEDLLAGRHAGVLADFTVISATDGNHGLALAAAARSLGCPCVIVLHARVSPEREAAIAALGARILRVLGNYDASVEEAARLAAAHGWHVVSDTSYEGYEAIPRDVMQGYATLADELVGGSDAAEPCPFTHVLLQGGVGGLAAGVVSYLWERYGEGRPAFIVVEPEQADCLFQSAIRGFPAAATGSVDSLMAGLACGRTSPLAWRFLQPSVDFFMTLTDAQAAEAMGRFAAGEDGDIPILSGESGAAGLAALKVLAQAPELRTQIGLDPNSHILLFNTEGATAPKVYEALTGRSPQAVRAAQAAWLEMHPP